MKYLLSWGWTLMVLWWEQWKGSKTIEEIMGTIAPETLTAESVLGYQLQICCRQRHYRRVYQHWFIPNQDFAVFEVYAITSQVAPEALRRACERSYFFPALRPRGVFPHVQEQAAIAAYLDLLIQRLQLEQRLFRY